MPLPGGVTTITVTGKYEDMQGNPQSGTVTFTPSTGPFTDPTVTVIFEPLAVVATLDDTGAFSELLPCTDNSGFEPNSWAWDVTERVTTPRSYTVELPSTLGASVDISTLAQVEPPTDYVGFLQLTAGSSSPVGGSLYLDGSPPIVLPSGTNGDVLTSDADGNITLQASSGSLPWTTLGDTLYEGTGPTPARLAGNTSATRKFYTQTGTGSVSAAPVWRTIAASDLPGPGDWLNAVTQYGATGNGTTDDTTAIQDALTAAASGQVVYLPAGTYKTSAPLTIPQGVTLMGASGGFAEPSGNYGIGGVPVTGSIIAPSSAFTPTSGNGAAVIYLTAGDVQSGQQSIRQISIDGQNAPGSNSIHGIQAYNAIAGVKLRDVLVYGGTSLNLGGNGLDMRPGANQNPDFWDVAHCKFSSMAGNGVSMNGVSDSWFVSVEATGNTGANWNITNCSNSRFVGCKGENSGQDQGWYITSASAFTGELAFTGCTSQFNHLDGWYLTGPGAGLYQFTGCRSAGDGESSGNAFTITGSFAGTALLTGWGSVPGSSTPADGLKISSVSSSAYIIASNCLFWGYSTAVSNDGSAGQFTQSNVVWRTGAAGSPSSLLAPATAVAWVNATRAPYGADNTGTNNATTAIQAAITAAAGGVCYLPAGTYKVGNLTLPSSTTLIGDGAGATVLSVAAGTTGAVIALTTPASVRRTCVRDLMIEGNNVSVTGISLDNTGLSPSTPGQHRLYNVTAQDCGVDAFYYGSALVETMTIGCTAYNAGRYGFNITTGATDSRWVSCTTGPSASHGFVVTGSNNHFSACKAYYAGYTGSAFTTGHGWYVLGTSAYPTMGITWDGCEAQDCAQQGWNFNPNSGSLNNLSMMACVIDSCNAAAGTGGAGSAVVTDYVVYSTIAGCTAWNRSGGAGNMTYGISVAGVQTGLVMTGNTWNCATGPFFYSSGYGYLLAEQYIFDLTGVSQYVKVPALVQAPASAQALTSSTAITVNTAYSLIPLTATGAVTGITMPTAGLQSGQTVTLVNQSAYSVTFAASGTSNVADGTSDIISANTAAAYTWDGNTSLWYRIHGGTGSGVTIDTTASDIQPAGVRAAGAVGLAADSGHVHQNYANLSLLYAPTGATAETYPRNQFTATSNIVMTSTDLYVRAIALPAGLAISNITFMLGSGASESGGSHGWYVLLDSSYIVRAVTADQTAATYWTTPAYTPYPLSVSASAYTTTYTGLYYVGICVVASTMPAMCGDTGPASQIWGTSPGPGPLICGLSSTGQSTPPPLGTTMTTPTASASYNFYAWTS